jgi:S-methylmethionine-dependent homocysteine/selenocysteine methylase
MSRYRNQLPQLEGGVFLTDGGLETTLVFHQGIDLPCFAAFDLMKNDEGRETLRNYFHTYVETARQHNAGFILESVTWRANADWGEKIGYSREELAEINRQSIAMLEEIRDEYETAGLPMIISGCIGPRGDGYNPSSRMNADEAEQYHATQIETFRDTAADMVSAFTINYVEEAIGIVHAARKAKMPVVISFTVETDGCLPTGQTLKDAIEQVDGATDNAPIYYMVNCAHPTHFEHTLDGAPWTNRIRGLRANASCRSHAELDEATELDAGHPEELGAEYRELTDKLRNMNVFGGCCGTDHRHIAAIADACLAIA